MANYFRYAILKRVLNAISKSDYDANNFAEKCSSLIRLTDKPIGQPHMILSWKDVNKICALDYKPVSNRTLDILNGDGLLIPDGILNVSNTGDEYLTFAINKDAFVKSVLNEVCLNVNQMKNSSLLLRSIAKKKIIFEYSSPNIAKPFHVGHIRSTILGNVLSNLYDYIGHKVMRLNYLGDWGTQYGILTAGYNDFGKEIERDEHPLRHLLNVYIAANAKAENDVEFLERAKHVFNEMESGNPELLQQWKDIKDLSLKEFNKIYSRLGVKFDSTESESLYHEYAKKLITELNLKGLTVQNDQGAVFMDIVLANGKSINYPLLKKDQSTLYITRDIAAAIKRKEKYDFDKMFYVVDSRQKEHFYNLKYILNKMGYSWAHDLEHISFGHIRGLSTRKGQVVFLDLILDKARELAMKSMENSKNTKVVDNFENTAEILGVSSVIINDLTTLRQNDYDFNWNKLLHTKGDSGISLQYAHARLASLEKVFGKLLNLDCDTDLLLEPEAFNLVLHLSKFDEVLYDMHNDLQPCYLVRYLFQLSNLIGKTFRVLSLKGSERRLAEPRYLLFHTSRLVLRQGFSILGFEALDEM